MYEVDFGRESQTESAKNVALLFTSAANSVSNLQYVQTMEQPVRTLPKWRPTMKFSTNIAISSTKTPHLIQRFHVVEQVN
jgi:hypothetical protein